MSANGKRVFVAGVANVVSPASLLCWSHGFRTAMAVSIGLIAAGAWAVASRAFLDVTVLAMLAATYCIIFIGSSLYFGRAVLSNIAGVNKTCVSNWVVILLIGALPTIALMGGWRDLVGVEIYYIASDSMAPAVHARELVVADSSKKALNYIDAGDVVIFRPESSPEATYWLKRVVSITHNQVDLAGDNVSDSVRQSELKGVPLHRIRGVAHLVVGKFTAGRFQFAIRQLTRRS